jgi:ABC-type multidrug transport system permease subunit
VRSVISGIRLQLQTAALTPLALVTTYLTPLSVSLLVMLRFGRPELDLMAGSVEAAVLNALVMQTFFAIMNERFGGTMQILAATPSGLLTPLIGRLVGTLMQGLAALPLMILLVIVVWGPVELNAAVHRGSLTIAVIGLFMAICSTCAMAVLHVGVAIRSVSYRGLVNAIFPVSVVAMGLFAPTETLPAPIRVLSWALPPAWAMEGIRTNSYRAMSLCAATAVIWIGLGFFLLRHLPAWLRTSPDTYTR